MKDAPYDVAERSSRFAVRVVKLSNALPRSVVGASVARQVLRSGTGVGANIEGAQGSHSREDFTRRMNIARSEASEALYRLRLIKETELVSAERIEPLIAEADELVPTLITIVKRSQAKSE